MRSPPSPPPANEIDNDKTLSLARSTYTAYNKDDEVTATTDARGNITTYSFDRDNRQTAVTDARGNLTTTAYDKDSNVLSTTDARGTVTSYDDDSNQAAEIDGFGSTAPRTILTAFDPDRGSTAYGSLFLFSSPGT